MIFNREEQQLVLEGDLLPREDVRRLVANCIDATPVSLCELYHFLDDWFNDSPYLTVKTSGSTGTLKQMKVLKDRMVQSARLICEYLGLRWGDSALLCVPLQYIAGKMVVVRALAAGLDLAVRTPSGHPMADLGQPLRFSAMVPPQVYNTLQVATERERLCRTDILITGGGAIDVGLEAEIRQLPGEVYSTHDMTETLSHIALRRLNGPDASTLYYPFPSVRLSLSPEHTLIIDAPLTRDTILVTNDVAEINPDGSFSILGRKDNTINTGGIRVQTEQAGDILRPWIYAPFAITSVSDAALGEAVVPLIENGGYTERLEEKMKELLTKYQLPKMVFSVGTISLTETGKINRAGCRQLAATYQMGR